MDGLQFPILTGFWERSHGHTYTLNWGQALFGVVPGRDPFILFRSRKESLLATWGLFCLAYQPGSVFMLPRGQADFFLEAQPVLTLPGPCPVVGGGLSGSGGSHRSLGCRALGVASCPVLT